MMREFIFFGELSIVFENYLFQTDLKHQQQSSSMHFIGPELTERIPNPLIDISFATTNL